MPDPFKFLDDTRMTSPDQWPCRRKELDALIQKYQYGPYPPAPDKVTGTLSGNSLSVKVEYQGRSMTLSCPVTMPSGNGPFPALISLSGAPVSVAGKNIATIAFDVNDVAQDGQARRSGAFYTLYGSAADDTGSLMAWGWGVHRIVDALEQIEQLDATKVIVNGFSRWGKGAAVAGAFDERIALTIISSSGAGGLGSWRSAQKQSSAGDKVQTLSQLSGEASWMTPDFGTNFGSAVDKLPFDGHEVVALIAPRPVLVTESADDSWNNPIGGYHSAVAAHMVWEYLGIPEYMGFSSHKNGGHAFGEQQAASAFIDRFILGQSADTTYMENPNNHSIDSSLIPWSTP